MEQMQSVICELRQLHSSLLWPVIIMAIMATCGGKRDNKVGILQPSVFSVLFKGIRLLGFSGG